MNITPQSKGMQMKRLAAAILISTTNAAFSQGLDIYKKCELAIYDVARFEDAEKTVGCKLSSLNKSTQVYVSKIKKYRVNFCKADEWTDLPERIEKIKRENREQLAYFEKYQGPQDATATFCAGLDNYAIRSSNVPN
jgi:hypothetical protein